MIHQARNNLIDFSIAIDEKYQDTWFHESIAEILESALSKVEQGQDARIILTIPPRHGKSEVATKKFPAWILGKHPDWEVKIASYSNDLAIDFGQATRDIMQSSAYQNVFPTRLRTDVKAKGNWKTLTNGGYGATGAGGAFTGKGFNVGIIDDLFKNREEAESKVTRDSRWDWYRSTFYTRQEGHTAIIVIGTRWHTDDVIGRLLEEEKKNRAENVPYYDKWQLIEFPAIAIIDEKYRDRGEALWPEKFPIEKLRTIENTLGPYEFSALYQCNPITTETQEFKKQWIKKRSWAEVEALNTRKIATIDPGGKELENDYTGITRNYIDQQNNWNLKSMRVHFDSAELINYVFKLHDEGFEEIGIEETVYMKAVKPFFDIECRKRNRFPNVTELKAAMRNKEVRIRGLIPRYASGAIFHIDNECLDLENEQVVFPKGAHDDTLDSCFIAGTKITTNKGQISIEKIKIGDKVLTRDGYKKVLNSWCTGKKNIIKNIGLVGTPNHPIITKKNIKELRYVGESDILYRWNERQSCIEEGNIIDIQNQNTGIYDHIIGSILQRYQGLYIDKFGLIILAKSLREWAYIIKISILSIMNLQIWNLLILDLMHPFMETSEIKNGYVSLQQQEENMQEYGIVVRKGELGIKNMLLKSHMEKKKNWFVLNVKNYLEQQLKNLLDIVQKNVKIGLMLGFIEKDIQISIEKGIDCIITKRKVYNLEVEGAHEYFANNILVHNCAYQNDIAKPPMSEFTIAQRIEHRKERAVKVANNFGLK